MKMKSVGKLLVSLLSLSSVAAVGWAQGEHGGYPAATLSDWTPPLLALSLPVTTVDRQGRLLFSDSPETVDTPGILFRGRSEGLTRLYFYHVNGTAEPLHLVVYGLSERAMTVGIRREVEGAPSRDWLKVGRRLSRDELTTLPRDRTVRLQALQPGLLLRERTVEVAPGELVSGILEWESATPFDVAVAMIPEGRTAQKYLHFWPEQPLDAVRLRGTFDATQRDIVAGTYIPARDRTRMILLADGAQDAFLQGRDEISGESTENTGNYGLRYRILIPSEGTGRYRLYFNPQGGTYAGDIAVEQSGRRRVVSVAGEAEGHPIGYGSTTHTVHIADVDTGKDVLIDWMPAGASNLPVRLWLVPIAPDDASADSQAQVLHKDEP